MQWPARAALRRDATRASERRPPRAFCSPGLKGSFTTQPFSGPKTIALWKGLIQCIVCKSLRLRLHNKQVVSSTARQFWWLRDLIPGSAHWRLKGSSVKVGQCKSGSMEPWSSRVKTQLSEHVYFLQCGFMPTLKVVTYSWRCYCYSTFICILNEFINFWMHIFLSFVWHIWILFLYHLRKFRNIFYLRHLKCHSTALIFRNSLIVGFHEIYSRGLF